MSNYRRRIKPIYCWELERWFDNQSEASKFLIEEKGLSHSCLGELNKWMNHTDRIVGGYHWCDSIDIFLGKKLFIKERRGVSKKIYCWETKEEYESSKVASEKTGIQKQNIKYILDNPFVTAGGFHWCTDLEKFKDAHITSDSKNSIKDIDKVNDQKIKSDNQDTVRENIPDGVDYNSLYKFPIKIFHNIIDYILKKEKIEQLGNEKLFYYFKARRDYNEELKDRAYVIMHSICPRTKDILEEFLKMRTLPDLEINIEWDDETMSFSKLTFHTGFGLSDYLNVVEDEDTFEELENVNSINELYTKIEDETY